MKNCKYIVASLLCVFSCCFVTAQEDASKGIRWSSLHGLEYELKAGIGMGGTAPLPLPREIRSIDYYSPGLNSLIEGNAVKWLDVRKQWGVKVGVRLENKSMTTKATVKNYGMEILNDNGGKLSGLWTGGVKTKVHNSYLSIPISAEYCLNSRWRFSLGVYFSYLLSGDFSGDVYEGHLRTPDETGSRVDFQGANHATYDFSNDLRKFQWGWQAGGEWKAFKHFNVFADLTWGLNNIFKSNFKTVTFNLYPIYLNLGFAYTF